MKPGDVVTVYEDPYTCQYPEGEAMLVRRLTERMDGSGRWEVRFRVTVHLDPDDREEWEADTYERLIIPRELAR